MIKIITASLISIGAVGCASDLVQTSATLPPVETYSETFRMQFANEVDYICGNSEKEIKEEYPYSCIFIQDSLKLRSEVKAIRGSGY